MSPQNTSGLPPELARGLAARLRDAAAAADRLADFAFAEAGDPPPGALEGGEEGAVGLDFARRALHAATEATNAAILHAAAAGPEGGVALAELQERAGLPRLAVLERVHELLQLGLVARDLPADTVCATPAGAALDALVADLGADVAAWLAARRRGA